MSNELAQQQAAGLRALADFIDAHPDLAKDIDYPLRTSFDAFLMCVHRDQKTRMAEWARAGAALGLPVRKDILGQNFTVALEFSPGVVVTLHAEREEVCERVVVGTETVTKQVPDPRVPKPPMVEVTETVERVEWRCSPVLGAKS